MRTRSVPERRSGKTFSRQQLGAGMTFLWRQPYLRTVLLVFGLGMNSAFSAMLFAALTIGSRGGHSGVGGGMIASMAAAGSLVGALLAPRLRPEARSSLLIAGTCWTCAVAVAVIAVFQQPLLIGLLAAACMATASVASIGFLTSLLLATPEEKVGRVQSAANFLSSLVQPLGPLVAGVLLTTWGATPTFALLGGVFTICAVVVTWAPSIRRHAVAQAGADRREKARDEQPDPATVDD
jgi:MFS family permease